MKSGKKNYGYKKIKRQVFRPGKFIRLVPESEIVYNYICVRCGGKFQSKPRKCPHCPLCGKESSKDIQLGRAL